MKRKDGNDKLSRVKRNITTSIDLFNDIEHFESNNKAIKELVELHETLLYFAMRVTKVLDKLIEEQGKNNRSNNAIGGDNHR